VHKVTIIASEVAVPRQRFDAVMIAFHWITLVLIVNQFGTGWLMHAASFTDHAALIFALHRCGGMAVWLLTLCRVIWRRLFADLPPFPGSMSLLQQMLARANEYGLYGLLLVQPLSGLGQILFRGLPIHLFFSDFSPLPPVGRGVGAVFHEVHEIGAVSLAALIGLHVSAALFHQLALRDRIIHRMLPAAFSSRRIPRRASAPLRLSPPEAR
jgi:cytochrome b561